MEGGKNAATFSIINLTKQKGVKGNNKMVEKSIFVSVSLIIMEELKLWRRYEDADSGANGVPVWRPRTQICQGKFP